jgi:hypothetical protein
MRRSGMVTSGSIKGAIADDSIEALAVGAGTGGGIPG